MIVYDSISIFWNFVLELLKHPLMLALAPILLQRWFNRGQKK